MALVNDFILEFGKDSIHVLNLVSPGWTCAIPVSNHIVNEMFKVIKWYLSVNKINQLDPTLSLGIIFKSAPCFKNIVPIAIMSIILYQHFVKD